MLPRSSFILFFLIPTLLFLMRSSWALVLIFKIYLHVVSIMLAWAKLVSAGVDQWTILISKSRKFGTFDSYLATIGSLQSLILFQPLLKENDQHILLYQDLVSKVVKSTIFNFLDYRNPTLSILGYIESYCIVQS
jgi:hypothetical protein